MLRVFGAVTSDTDPGSGDFDGYGNSYSAAALAAVGITPDATVSCSGLRFTWPSSLPGTKDNVAVDGQTVALFGSGQTLGFLGAAVNTTVTSGPATITYTDGTTQDFTLSLTGWDQTAPLDGNALAVRTKVRNRTSAGTTAGVNLFCATVALTHPGTVAAVTLPVLASGGPHAPAMHLFAVAIG